MDQNFAIHPYDKYFLSKEILDKEEPSGDLSYNWVLENSDLTNLEQPISITNFREESANRLQDMEFRILRRITETNFHIAKLEEFQPHVSNHNRYDNIIPFKHTKIILPPLESELDDQDKTYQYINANYINTSLNDRCRLIATQGPNLVSIPNFWKMIYFENVELIIMLCNLEEKKGIQCDQYWPEKNDDYFEYSKKMIDKELRVKKIKEVIVKKGLIERTIIIDRIEEEEVTHKEVLQIQWTEWNDQSIPEKKDYEILKDLLETMIKIHIEKPEAKIAIHCSAGVGRTGTLLSLFNLLLILKKFEITYNLQKNNLSDFKLSIFGIVRRLREQRWGMIHTTEQYMYLYEFMAKYIDEIFLSKENNLL